MCRKGKEMKIYERNRERDADKYLKLIIETLQIDMGSRRNDIKYETEYPLLQQVQNDYPGST